MYSTNDTNDETTVTIWNLMPYHLALHFVSPWSTCCICRLDIVWRYIASVGNQTSEGSHVLRPPTASKRSRPHNLLKDQRIFLVHGNRVSFTIYETVYKGSVFPIERSERRCDSVYTRKVSFVYTTIRCKQTKCNDWRIIVVKHFFLSVGNICVFIRFHRKHYTWTFSNLNILYNLYDSLVINIMNDRFTNVDTSSGIRINK